MFLHVVLVLPVSARGESSPFTRVLEQVRRGEAARECSGVSVATRQRTAVNVGMRLPEAVGIAGHSAEMCVQKQGHSAAGRCPS